MAIAGPWHPDENPDENPDNDEFTRDAGLMQAADKGELKTKEQVAAHIRRLLDDPKIAKPGLLRFFREYFEYHRAVDVFKDQRQQELLAKSDELKRHAPRLGEKLTTSTSSLILEAQFEIAAAARIAGLTNVVTLISGGGGQRFGQFPEFGIPDLHHIGHGGAYGDKNYDACFVELRRFHTKLIAGLTQRLANVPEGDGTMLDNTLIVYLSDSGESHHPNLYDWPVVLIGNLGGRLRTEGRYLEFPRYQAPRHRTMANLYCTLLHAAGKPRDKFGVDDPGLQGVDQSGVVAELLS